MFVNEISESAGCACAGTPLVEIEVKKLCDTEAMDSTPPSVLDDGFGKSAPTNDRNAGVVAAPVVGPAKTLFADSFAHTAVSVPLVVTGLPLTVNSAGRES